MVGGLSDRCALEGGDPNAPGRELGEERNRIDERGEAVHTGAVDGRASRPAQLCGREGEHRSRGDRGAFDDAVDDDIALASAPAVDLDAGRAPLAFVAAPAAHAEAPALRLAEAHTDRWNAR